MDRSYLQVVALVDRLIKPRLHRARRPDHRATDPTQFLEITMKKIAQLFVAGLMIGLTLPVFAGPDWATIEMARKAKQTAQVQQLAQASAPTAPQPSPGRKECPRHAPIKQLDHGPRATTSPYITARRQAEYEAQMRACHDDAK